MSIMFNAIIARIYKATNTNTQVELAHALNIVQSTIAYWLKNKHIPFWCLDTLYEQNKINPLWILSGEGTIKIDAYPGIESIKQYIDENNLPISFALKKRAQSQFKLEVSNVKSSLSLDEQRAQSLNSLQINAQEIVEENSIVHVPLYSSKYTGLTNENGNVFQLESYIPMPKSKVKSSYMYFRLHSASMEPSIQKNSIIVIDTSIVDFNSGKIYAFVMPKQELCLALVQVPMLETKKAQIELLFENPSFPLLPFPYEHAKKYLLGKLIAKFYSYE